jgi:UDP-glucose 4-epimerase
LKRKVLVTGGAGFIGSNLVERLINDGNHVICIDNESGEYNIKPHWHDNAENYKYDICNYEAIFPLFENVDTVFHLAAESKIQPAINNPLLAFKTNVLGTANIAQAARENNIRRVVYSTTSAYYGIKNPIPNIETQQEDCLNPYSVSKVSGDKIMKMYYDLYGLETISLRYFNVYGKNNPTKGQYAPVIGLFLKQKAENKPLTVVGNGLQKRDFINVDDVVNANIMSMNCKLDSYGEVFNVGYGKNYSILEIANLISDNITFISPRIAESVETLSDTNKIQKLVGWKASVDVTDWIKQQLSGTGRT